MRSVHDVGGLDFGAVPLEDHEMETWEKRSNAVANALRQKHVATLDEQRRHVEALGDGYHNYRYFERHVLAWAQIAIDRGLLTSAELGRMLADPSERPPVEPIRRAHEDVRRDPASARASAPAPARFKPGDRVRVLKSEPPGHVRTPWYCRGHVGVIERICGAFPNPEELAYRRSGLPATTLYRVRFRSRDLWPGYGESPADTVDIEIYAHWLEGT
jgi:nitrile hydratase